MKHLGNLFLAVKLNMNSWKWNGRHARNGRVPGPSCDFVIVISNVSNLFSSIKIIFKKCFAPPIWKHEKLLRFLKKGETFGQFRFLVIFKAQEASWEMANNLFGRNSTWPAKFLLFQSETLEGYFLDIDCQ